MDKFYSGNNLDIYCGDCLDILPGLPDKSVDLVFTSPPFNLGGNHHTGNYRHRPYDDCIPEQEYQDWQLKVLDELYRVVKDKGSCWYQHKNRIKDGVSITPYLWLLKSKWPQEQQIWHY